MKVGRLRFREGTTIIHHKYLLSFLHNKDPRIFHREFSDLELKIVNDILNGDIHENNSFVEELRSSNIIREDANNNVDILTYKETKLLHLLVEITNRCNMDCIYCYTEANEHYHKEKELSGEEWTDLFESVRIKSRFIVQNISLTGGEPTIHPDFDKVLRYLSGKYKIEISSNGLNYRKSVLDSILECESLHFLNISMDSVFKEEDEFMRGSGTFDRRIKNLEILSRYDIPICISVVVSTMNLESLEKTTDFYLQKFPNITIKYIPMTNIGRAMRFDNDNYFLSGENAFRFNEKLMAMKEKYGNRILSDPSNNNNNLSHWSGRCSHMKYQFEPLVFKDKELLPERCNAGYGVVDLSPSGRLRPCLRADSFFKESLSIMPKDKIMPKISGKSLDEINALEFWEYVSEEVSGFNPIETCAFKTVIRNYGGTKNGH